MDAAHLTSTVENQVCLGTPVDYDQTSDTTWIGIG